MNALMFVRKTLSTLVAPIKKFVSKKAALNEKTVPLKQECVRSYGQRYKIQTMVETGTFRGGMIAAVKDSFSKVYSIELSERLHAEAKERFRGDSHVRLIQGDSKNVLAEVLRGIDEPCVFWLDGHYSGGDTACGELKCPVLHELRAIFSHKIKNHVILIDDARCFGNTEDWPSLEEIKAMVDQQQDPWTCEIREDVIRIVNTRSVNQDSNPNMPNRPGMR